MLLAVCPNHTAVKQKYFLLAYAALWFLQLCHGGRMDLYFLVPMLSFSEWYEVKICLSYLLFEYIIFQFVALKMECSLIYAYLYRLPQCYLEFAFSSFIQYYLNFHCRACYWKSSFLSAFRKFSEMVDFEMTKTINFSCCCMITYQFIWIHKYQSKVANLWGTPPTPPFYLQKKLIKILVLAHEPTCMVSLEALFCLIFACPPVTKKYSRYLLYSRQLDW